MAKKREWPFEKISKGRNYFARVICVRTGAHKEVRIKRSSNNYEIDQIIIRNGYKLTDRGYELTQIDGVNTVEIKKEQPKMNANQSQKSLIAQVRVIQLLEEYFDKETGQFTDKYTDERIAKETSISIEYVKNIRCTAYGDLKEPAEIIKLREEFAALHQMTLEGLKRIEAIQRKYK